MKAILFVFIAMNRLLTFNQLNVKNKEGPHAIADILNNFAAGLIKKRQKTDATGMMCYVTPFKTGSSIHKKRI